MIQGSSRSQLGIMFGEIKGGGQGAKLPGKAGRFGWPPGPLIVSEISLYKIIEKNILLILWSDFSSFIWWTDFLNSGCG